MPTSSWAGDWVRSTLARRGVRLGPPPSGQLALDDSLAHAHASLGSILAHYEWRPSEAGVALKRALDLSPSDPMVNNAYAMYLLALGRPDEAISFFERAIVASPAEPRLRQDLGWGLYLARDYPRAAEEFEHVLEASPDLQVTHWILGWVYVELGRDSEAFAAWARSGELIGWREESSRGFAAAYRHGGLRGADALPDRTGTRASTRSARLGPSVSGYLGNADAAFRALEQSYRRGNPGLASALPVWPSLDPIRSDPRYDDLLRRIGFPDS